MNISDLSQETQLMERCVECENMLKAWKGIKKNGGSPEVDGLNIDTCTPEMEALRKI